MPYRFTTDQEEFIKSDLPKFSYGKSRVGDALFVPSADLLFEKGISKQFVEFDKWNGLAIFFKIENGDIPFDIFAASFFLVTRYEEYLPHSKDNHDRFRSEESTAFKGGFLDRPIINLWVEEFKKTLKSKYPQLIFSFPSFTFTPTIDIDNAYAYKHKGVIRAAGGMLEKLLKLQFKKFVNRLRVHTGTRKDPYDSYEKQARIHQSYNIKPLYFVLLGDYGKYDKNLSYKNKYMIRLIQKLGKAGNVGLHPSYNSNGSEKNLSKEKERLCSILGTDVQRSRQHYIRLQLPYTYRNLIRIGIKEDYSMGFPSKIGFRASTCTPFYFFDLEENKTTDLKVYPFVAMDSTLKYYLRFRSKEVIPFLRPIVNEIKSLGGNFVFVFHNESIGDGRNWRNWGDIYERVIQLSLADNHQYTFRFYFYLWNMFILSEGNSIANHFISELRSIEVQKDSMRFRRNMERIGEIFAYEISKKLAYRSAEVKTPLGISKTFLMGDAPILVPVLRAGIPFYHGFLNFFDKSDTAFIAAYRANEGTMNEIEIKMEYLASPSIDQKTIILIDPMLATGKSLETAYQALLKFGKPTHVHIASVIASKPAINYLKEKMPDASLWIGAVDPELNHKSYIIPGLGDAGDLAFGEKI